MEQQGGKTDFGEGTQHVGGGGGQASCSLCFAYIVDHSLDAKRDIS